MSVAMGLLLLLVVAVAADFLPLAALASPPCTESGRGETR